MKEHLKASIFPLIIIMLMAASAWLGVFIGKSSNEYTINNTIDSTRDINYECYCDSIWYTNREYYLDVLVESDKYQSYVEEHGEWWNY